MIFALFLLFLFFFLRSLNVFMLKYAQCQLPTYFISIHTDFIRGHTLWPMSWCDTNWWLPVRYCYARANWILVSRGAISFNAKWFLPCLKLMWRWEVKWNYIIILVHYYGIFYTISSVQRSRWEQIEKKIVAFFAKSMLMRTKDVWKITLIANWYGNLTCFIIVIFVLIKFFLVLEIIWDPIGWVSYLIWLQYA